VTENEGKAYEFENIQYHPTNHNICLQLIDESLSFSSDIGIMLLQDGLLASK